MENSLESPLHLGEYHLVQKGNTNHLGEYHVVTLKQRRDLGVANQHFQTVRAPPSGCQYTLRQGIKYNTSNKPVLNNFNTSGYYLKPAPSERSVEDWCENWSPSQSSQGNIYAEVGSQDYEGDSGYTEGSSDVASEKKEESLYVPNSSNSILCNHKTRTGKKGQDTRKSLNPNVFSISRSVVREGGNYCNEHSQLVGGGQIRSDQMGGQIDRGQIKFGRTRLKE